MFGGKKTLENSTPVESIIGNNTTLEGSLTCGGALRIDGQFAGEGSLADLIVGESGRVTAQVAANNALVAGSVTGNVNVANKLELLPTAKVVGDLNVDKLIVGEGAVFQGRCEMRRLADG